VKQGEVRRPRSILLQKAKLAPLNEPTEPPRCASKGTSNVRALSVVSGRSLRYSRSSQGRDETFTTQTYERTQRWMPRSNRPNFPGRSLWVRRGSTRSAAARQRSA